MVKLLLRLCVFLIFTFKGFSQNANRIRFDYDSAGNQKKRYICLCTEKNNPENEIKKNDELKDEDLLKLSDQDIISYYPNPVHEELYLKWELVNDNKVYQIDLYSFSGQKIQSIKALTLETSKVVSFANMAEGTYMIKLLFTDGTQKSITIIKK